ncbi:MAG: hypothetical protein ABIF19_18715 [Planctomycetota bacterium]
MSKAKNKCTGGELPGWHSAADVLERLRIEAIRRSDTAAAIEQLSDAFESARLHYPAAPTSGLVEQQRLFSRWRP